MRVDGILFYFGGGSVSMAHESIWGKNLAFERETKDRGKSVNSLKGGWEGFFAREEGGAAIVLTSC